MLSLPCITPQDLLAFEEALGKTSSLKEQKQLMRSLLLVGTGNQLKALAVQKSVNVITNVVGKKGRTFLNLEITIHMTHAYININKIHIYIMVCSKNPQFWCFSARPRSSISASDSRTEDGGAIGLAAIM